MTGNPGGDTGQFIYRVPLPHDNSKLMDFRGGDTTTDSGTGDDSRDSIDPHDFEQAFVRSDSILQVKNMLVLSFYQKNEAISYVSSDLEGSKS